MILKGLRLLVHDRPPNVLLPPRRAGVALLLLLLLLLPLLPPAPNVRPGLAKDAPGAAVPASLMAFSTAAVRAGGLAPRMVSMTAPLLKMRKVGMALTPWDWAMAWWLSTLTLQNVILPGLVYLVDRDSNVGAIILQGPHQSA